MIIFYIKELKENIPIEETSNLSTLLYNFRSTTIYAEYKSMLDIKTFYSKTAEIYPT